MKILLNIDPQACDSFIFLKRYRIPELIYVENFIRSKVFGQHSNFVRFISNITREEDLRFSLFEIAEEMSTSTVSMINTLSELMEQYNATDITILNITDNDLTLEIY